MEKMKKNEKDFGPGSPKKRFFGFSRIFYETKSGNLDIVARNLGISSETTQESRVRRPGNQLDIMYLKNEHVWSS